MLVFASAQAGILPAVVDVSHGWGAHSWSSPLINPWAAGIPTLGLPSLTTSWGSPWGSPWNAHGIPSIVAPAIAHGHEG